MTSEQNSSTLPCILLVDDHHMMATGLAHLLPDHYSTRLAHTMQEMTDLCTNCQFDLAILDIHMHDVEPDMCFLQHLLNIKVPVLLLTGEASEAEILDFLKKGARGVVWKKESEQIIIQAVQAVLSGQTWISPELIASIEKRAARRRLTLREQDILDYFFLDRVPTNKQIAMAESISADTVRNYVAALFNICDVDSRHELAAKARLLGYAPSGRKLKINRLGDFAA